MDKIRKGFVDYRMSGGEATFNEWYDALLNKAYELDEKAIYEELDEDFNVMDEYYTELCEELKISFKKEKNTNKRLNGAELKKKYEIYKKKRQKAGKSVLSFSEWTEKQQFAKEAEKELKSAGIKIVGNTALAIGAGAAAVAAHKIKEKGGVKTEQDAKSKQASASYESNKRKFTLTARTEYK